MLFPAADSVDENEKERVIFERVADLRTVLSAISSLSTVPVACPSALFTHASSTFASAVASSTSKVESEGFPATILSTTSRLLISNSLRMRALFTSTATARITANVRFTAASVERSSAAQKSSGVVSSNSSAGGGTVPTVPEMSCSNNNGYLQTLCTGMIK
jgi:hypothetical protein